MLNLNHSAFQKALLMVKSALKDAKMSERRGEVAFQLVGVFERNIINIFYGSIARVSQVGIVLN